jgi:hypothetical protein
MRVGVGKHGGVSGRSARGPRSLLRAAAVTALITAAGTLTACAGGGAAAAGSGGTPVTTHPSPAASMDTAGSAPPPSGAASTSATPGPMPVGDPPGWHQVFADDFRTDVPVGGFSGCDDGTTRTCSGLPAPVRATWWAYPDGWADTSKQGTYTPSKTISIQNGMIHLHMYTADGRHLVAAPVPKIPDPAGAEGGQLHGRYAVRFEVQAPAHGYKVAWLLWPDSEKFPGDGEIDFPESALDGDITAFTHHRGATSGSDQDEFNTAVPLSSGWHTTVIEWTASACRFILDGTAIGTSTSRLPDTPMHLVLQSETVPGRVTSNAETADIFIAWITVYRPA